MKALKLLAMVAGFSLVFMGIGLAGRGWSSGPAAGMPGAGYNPGAFLNMINQMPIQPISDAERSGVIKMRQEEKLARDVYRFLANRWNIPAFGNIAQAEQVHMDAIQTLMNKYGIPDPVHEDIPGKFSDPAFQGLYDELTARGMGSLENALKVGATIEDMDIYDLNAMMVNADNEDIRFVYQNLMAGSMNHMRAFSRIMGRYGYVYTPRYISQEAYNNIMAGM